MNIWDIKVFLNIMLCGFIMNNKIVLFIVLIAIMSVFCVNATNSDDSDHKVKINSIKFIIPEEFNKVESKCEIGDTYVKLVYSDGKDELSINVRNANDMDMKDVDWNKLYQNPYQRTIANKDGISSDQYYPFDTFVYMENGKAVEIQVPKVSSNHGTSEEFIDEIIYQGNN